MFKAHENKEAAEFANAFLERYTAVGFGALSKREVDLMMLQLLQKHLPNFKDKSDFDAALFLKTTKRKIRGLRDEISFRESQSEEQLKEILRTHLIRAEVLSGNHGMVMLQLDDAVIRGFAEKVIRSEFGIVDSSFNSSIMQLSGEKYLLLAFNVLTEEEQMEALDTIEKLNTGRDLPGAKNTTPFAVFRKGFVQGIGIKSGELFVSGGMALATGGVSLLLEGGEIAGAARKGIGAALKQARSLFIENDTP